MIDSFMLAISILRCCNAAVAAGSGVGRGSAGQEGDDHAAPPPLLGHEDQDEADEGLCLKSNTAETQGR